MVVEDLLMSDLHLDILTKLVAGIKVTVEPGEVTAGDVYSYPMPFEEDVASGTKV